MTEKSFMTVEEVAAELRVSKSKAYQSTVKSSSVSHGFWTPKCFP